MAALSSPNGEFTMLPPLMASAPVFTLVLTIRSTASYSA